MLLGDARSRALIKVGYGCNNRCLFCHTLDNREVRSSGAEVARKITRAAQLGFGSAVLSGGEATIRPELLAWAGQIARHGLELGLVTNGRMLAYPELVDKLQRFGLGYVHLSLHSANPEIHDRLVRADAFEQTLRAIGLLADGGLALTVACVVTRYNLSHLRQLVQLLSPFGGLCLKFSMAEPKGGGRALFDELVPPVSEAAAAVVDAIDFGTALGQGGRYAHESFPLCLLPGKAHLLGDLRASGFTHMSEAFEEDFFPVDNRNRVHAERCRDCALRGACPGLFVEYDARRGSGELEPLRAPRSNCFHYLVSSSSLPWKPPAPCPVRELPPAVFDRNRALFIRRENQLRVCKTETRDFADSEIGEIKHAKSQLYLDISRKTAPDDFSADLLKLAPLDECNACPEREGCPGCYRAAAGDVFAAEDERLHRLLATLQGRVLEVGCGDGRYTSVFAPECEAGRISYLGVEPNATAAQRARDLNPWAQVVTGRVEELALEEGTWDHVLVLNSYNHLRSPEEVMPKLVDAVRPSGTFTVADNTAFALVRSPEQSRRAEAGPARFEHYRNHSAREAMQLLSGLGLQLLESREVGSNTGNGWYLHFRTRNER